MEAHNHLELQFERTHRPLLASSGTACMRCADMGSNSHSYKKINVFSKRKKGGLGMLLSSEGFSSVCEALGSILSPFHARTSLCKHLRDITHNPQTSKPFNLDCVALCDWSSLSPVPALLPVPITRNSSLSSTLRDLYVETQALLSSTNSISSTPLHHTVLQRAPALQTNLHVYPGSVQGGRPCARHCPSHGS